MKRSPPLKHAARFICGRVRRCFHETVVCRRNYEQCVRLICEQDDGSEQPTPVRRAEIGDEPENPA